MSDNRKQPRLTTAPDECEIVLWDAFDLVERLRKRSTPLARQAARAALEAVREVEALNKPATHERNAA